MNLTDCVSSAARDRFNTFKAKGKLDLEGTQRRELDAAQATDLYTQFRGQMDQIISLDNVMQVDHDVTPGHIDSDVLGEGVKLKARYQGNTRTGTIAGEISSSDQGASQFIAEFGAGSLTVIQTVDLGEGKLGTMAASLNPNGKSFIDSHDVPEGSVLLV